MKAHELHARLTASGCTSCFVLTHDGEWSFSLEVDHHNEFIKFNADPDETADNVPAGEVLGMLKASASYETNVTDFCVSEYDDEWACLSTNQNA